MVAKYRVNEGEKYHKLTAIKASENRKYHWIFKCDCGNFKEINIYNILIGPVKSCGCLMKELNKLRPIKHGHRNKRIYKNWQLMLNRCRNKNDPGYKNYGGRGISVCEEWKNFENFYRDMGDKPIGMSLDRIDNNGNYCKDNCRWATRLEQANNTRKNVFITFENKTMTLSNWSRETGINYSTLSARLKVGYELEEVFAITKNKDHPKRSL